MTKPAKEELAALAARLAWFRENGKPLPPGFRRTAERAIRQAGGKLHRRFTAAQVLELALLVASQPDELLKAAEELNRLDTKD